MCSWYELPSMDLARFVRLKLTPRLSEGGVIAIDPAGNVALIFNTEGMYRASINRKGEKVIGIFREGDNAVINGQDLSDG